MTSQKNTMWNLDEVASSPMFKSILKAVIKNQMQCLMDQLSSYTDEEFLFVSASMAEKTLNHLGSESGNCFLDHHDDIMLKFLEFCDKRHHGQLRQETPVGAEVNKSNESYFVIKTRAKSWRKILPKPSDQQKGNIGTESLTELGFDSERDHSQTFQQHLPQEFDFWGSYKDCHTPRKESRKHRKKRTVPYPVSMMKKTSKANVQYIPELASDEKENLDGVESDDQTFSCSVQIKTEPSNSKNDIQLEADHNMKSGIMDLSSSLGDHCGLENNPKEVSGDCDGNEVTDKGRNKELGEYLDVTIQTIPESEIKLETPDQGFNRFPTSLENVGPSTSCPDMSVIYYDDVKEKDELESDADVKDRSASSKSGTTNRCKNRKKEDKIQCLYCNSCFDSDEALLQHRIEKHGSDIDWIDHEHQLAEFRALISIADSTLGNGGPSIILKCPYRLCKKSFKEESAYTEHVNEHFGLFTCFKCDKKIRGRPNRNTHIRICTGLTSYRCELCNREYTNITALKRHTLAVHLSKRYVCHCGMVYRYSSSLVKHQKKNSH